MGKANALFTIDLARARAHWHARAGLAEPKGSRPATVVGKTGWPRTLGGIEAYLAIAARGEGITAAAVHRAVGRGAPRVVPAVRGCIYLVPKAEAPSTLGLAAQLSATRTQRDLDKCGVKAKEVAGVAAAVKAWLADNGSATTDAIRRGLPDGTVRSLGAVGKKVGLSSPLPVALRQLEFAGAIVRSSEGGRLDNERYLWALTGDDEVDPATLDFDALVDAVVGRYMQNAGPATVKDVADWAGIPQREVKAAFERAGAEPMRIEGEKASVFALASQVAALSKPAESSSRIALLPFEDNFVALRGGPARLADPEHHDVPVESWGSSKPSTLGKAKHLSSRPIICGDRLVGFWEYDPDALQIVTALFAKVPRGAKTALKRECESVNTLISEIGHGRSFSLSTDDDLRRRVAKLKAAGG